MIAIKQNLAEYRILVFEHDEIAILADGSIEVFGPGVTKEKVLRSWTNLTFPKKGNYISFSFIPKSDDAWKLLSQIPDVYWVQVMGLVTHEEFNQLRDVYPNAVFDVSLTTDGKLPSLESE